MRRRAEEGPGCRAGVGARAARRQAFQGAGLSKIRLSDLDGRIIKATTSVGTSSLGLGEVTTGTALMAAPHDVSCVPTVPHAELARRDCDRDCARMPSLILTENGADLCRPAPSRKFSVS
jgi:hypothetical protein